MRFLRICCAGCCCDDGAVDGAWAGSGIYVTAARALRHGTTNMNTLVSLGTGVAFAYSAYATLRPGPGRAVYFDAVLLIVGFLLLGKSLEVRAKRRALSALDRCRVCGPSPPAGLWRASKHGTSRGDPAGRSDCHTVRASGFRWTPDPGRAHQRGRIDAYRRIDAFGARTGRAGAGRVAQLRRRYCLPAESTGRSHGAGADHAHGGAGAGSRAPLERLADRASAIFVPVVLGLRWSLL